MRDLLSPVNPYSAATVLLFQYGSNMAQVELQRKVEKHRARVAPVGTQADQCLRDHAGTSPSEEYARAILDGARELGLPDTYIRELQAATSAL